MIDVDWTINICIYIYYIYTGDYTRSPVGESPRLSGEMQNWSFWKCPETFRRISVQPGPQSGTNASFGAIQFFPLLQSFLYNCKAVRTDIITVYMCNERHHPHPTPTHPTMISVADTQT